MSEGAVNVGHIIAYLSLNRSDWDRGIEEAERRARGLDRVNPNIRIGTNVPIVIAQLRAVSAAERDIGDSANKATPPTIGLWTALAAIAPAAVPIAAVAGGALIGLVPVAATVAFGIAGITDELKSGALEGTKFGQDINVLKNEFTQLKSVAAGGLLSGLDQAMAGLHPLFGIVNADVRTMSTQIGAAAGIAVPALVTILTQLNPLFVTFGNLLVNGATHLAGWAKSTTGVQSFVAYVQAELPEVLQVLGNLVVLFSHIVQASAPMGSAILGGLGVLVRVLNSMPVGVLQILVPLLESAYLAFKAYQGITFIMTAVNTALTAHRTAAAATSAAVRASTLAEQATVAQASAAEAVARAEMAASVSASQAAVAASLAGTGSMLEAEAAAVAQASAEEAAAFQGAADAAVASSAEISAAAERAAVASRTAGGAAAGGWAAMLGPIGAVAIGVGVLAMALGHHNEKAQDAAKAQNSYAESVKQSTDAMATANIAQTNKNLSDSKALSTLDVLNGVNKDLGLTYSDLTMAVNGTNDQFQLVMDRLDGAAAKSGGTAIAVNFLKDKLTTLRGGLDDATKAQMRLAEAQKQAQIIQDGGNSAVAANARMLGTTSDAYLAAQQAAQKNTESTKQQTLAFQVEGNAAGLVNQALQSMAGQNLSVAQAQTTLDSATLSMVEALKTNKGAMDEHTQAGINDRQAIEGAASAVRAKMVADASAGQSTEAATATYHRNAEALLVQIGKLNGTTSAAYKYAQGLLKIPPVVSSTVYLHADAAAAKAAAIKAQLDDLTKQRTALLKLNDNKTSDALWNIQRRMEDLDGSIATVRVNVIANNSVGKVVHDAVNSIGHNAAGTSDWRGGWTWVGENGPELLQLPAHSKVKSNTESTRTTGSGRGTSPVQVAAPNVNVTVLLDGQEIDSRADVRIEHAMKTINDGITYN